MPMELIAGIMAILGSVFLSIPAYLGLGNRRAFENAEKLYEIERRNAMKANTPEKQQEKLLEAREAYEGSRDGIIAKVMGRYRLNYLWTVAGIIALCGALFLLIYARQSA